MTSTDNALWCVIPAAGRGSRVGGEIPKQYLPVAGKPLLMQTLERIATHPRIAGIVLVLAPDDARWNATPSIAGKPVRCVIGGEHRADSVLAGLFGLSGQIDDAQFVLVHDAARPCVRHADITRLLELAVPAGGGLLATPLSDTLKRGGADNRVVATEPREARWRAQTPQLFRLGELIQALQACKRDGLVATDEAMAMERSGAHPLLVQGHDDNIKVTTPADLVMAQYLLSRTTATGQA